MEHSRLRGGDREGREAQCNLLNNDVRPDGLNGSHLAGDFGHHACDGREPIAAEIRKSLEVGLSAGSSAIVGAGDCEDDRLAPSSLPGSR